MATVVDKLVLAAYACEQSGRTPFSAEDLVVSAWQQFPDTFGLSGHPSGSGLPAYPDSNRVFAEVMGSKPIRTKGLLVKVGVKMYELTESGRELARMLASSGPARGTDDAAAVGLGREIQNELKKLIASRAVQKVERDALVDLTFHDACMFWGITPHSSAVELRGRRAHVDGLIAAARRALRGGRARFAHGGAGFSSETVDALIRTQELLSEHFASEMATINKRNDQRAR